jgi:hypothetical protein
MCPHIVGKKNVVLDRDVARERHLVREDVVVANHAVMGHVNSDHEKVPRTDTGCQSFAVGAMKSAELANDIVVPDFEITGLAFELHILRFAPDHSVLEDPVAGADPGESFDYSVGSNLTIWPNFDVILDYGSGVNGHFGQEFTKLYRFSG